jgi:DNA polymerase
MASYTLNGDGETRSLVDLTQVGTHIYAAHPSTKLLTFSYSFDVGKTMSRWRPWLGKKMPSDLADALHDRDVELRAWHASFERHIFRDVCGIDVPAERWHCTMVRSRSMALPGSLEMCARALEMPIKKGDASIMLRWCALQKDGTWADDPQEYEELCSYCDDDVRAEAGLASVLRELTQEERQDYAVNERINDRGLMVDLSLARAAQHYARDELADICDRLNIITRGVVTSPKQYQRVKTWLAERLPPELAFILEPDEKTGKISFDAATREEVLGVEYEDVLFGETRELVELVHDGGKASISKFTAMQTRAGADQRVRGAYNMNGAGQTGRLSSSGLQVHNYIRASLPNIEDAIEAVLRRASKDDLIRLTSFDADGGLAFVDSKRRERIKKPFNILTILSRMLRPSIIAPPGKILVWRDWSAIEARVLPWLSAENSASQVLEVFASGKDLYVHQAVLSFGVTPDDVTPALRQAAKVQTLAFGYAGGSGAGMRMARAYGLDVDERTAEEWKNAWRATNPWAQRFWGKLEVAAFQAVRNPDATYDAGRVSYLCTADILWCMLPSGRLISYPFPKVESVPGRWGMADTITCMKSSLHPKKGTNYWPRMKLYGGVLCENVSQAEAASLLRWALRELAANGWQDCMVGSTHDEILLEVDEDEEEEAQAVLKDVMNNPPPAIYGGLPLASEGSSGFSYGKG